MGTAGMVWGQQVLYEDSRYGMGTAGKIWNTVQRYMPHYDSCFYGDASYLVFGTR